VERRASTIPTRRTVKTAWQAGWLLRAISLMDLTDAVGRRYARPVLRLCAKARRPVRRICWRRWAPGDLGVTVAAVCVYHAFVETAVRALEGSGIPVAAVSTGFPAGLSPLPQRLAGDRSLGGRGAKEIDIVITRAHVLTATGARSTTR
jgi:deoxyribose-phosphate aldolase